MQERLTELQLARGRLLERITHQRQVLAGQAQPVGQLLRLGDRVSGAIAQAGSFARQHPLAVAVAVGALVVLRPGGVWRWSRRALLAWRTWTAVRASLPGMLSRLF